MDVQINKFNKILIDTFDKEGLGLDNGQMGYCIYFFWLSRIENNKEYRKFAENLIDEIFEKVHTLKAIDINNGLSGIGIGINYLIREGYVTGNINVILKTIDDLIFRHLCIKKYYNSIDSIVITHLLYYLYIRVKDQKINSESHYLFKELIIKTVNILYEKVDSKLSEEPVSYIIDYQLPLFLFVLSKIYSLDYYNYRIIKILEEISPRVLTIIPFLQSNRLYLLWGLDSISKQVEIFGWNNHIKLLRRECDIDHILINELGKNNIFFNDGVASIYYLLSELHNYFPPCEIRRLNLLMDNKVKSSDFWKLLELDLYSFDNNKGLLSGFCGVSIMLNLIKLSN